MIYWIHEIGFIIPKFMILYGIPIDILFRTIQKKYIH